jgi:uncharacterized SAM-binding protein YcdF (DUF218 family)
MDMTVGAATEGPKAELRARGGHLTAAARGLAAFLGGFLVLNLFGQVLTGGFDGNVWLVDLRPLPKGVADAFLVASSVLLVGFAVRPRMTPWRRRWTGWACFGLFLAAAWNAARFYVLLDRGTLRAGVPLPLSVMTGLAFWVVLWSVRTQLPDQAPPRRRLVTAAVFVACLGAFPLAQMLFFGTTDYSRRADAIVVFGAGVSNDGEPSDALKDRVRTACRLYREGLAGRIVMSGGTAPGGASEAEVMRRMAIDAGVPAEAILVDAQGANTRATVRHTTEILSRIGARKVLAVSHSYHLARVKMTYQQQGLEVYTVPADESYTLSAMPYYIAREVAAICAYYLQPLAG